MSGATLPLLLAIFAFRHRTSTANPNNNNNNPNATLPGNATTFPPFGATLFPPFDSQLSGPENPLPPFNNNNGPPGSFPPGTYPSYGNPQFPSDGTPPSGSFPSNGNPSFPVYGNPAAGFPSAVGGYPGFNPATGYPIGGGPVAGFPSAVGGNPAAAGGYPPGGFPSGGDAPNYPYSGGSPGVGVGAPNWAASGGGNGFPPGAFPGGSSGYPQPPTSADSNPVGPPMDIKELANSLLNDESTFDVYLPGADGTLVGANSLILSKISATFRKLIEKARRDAAFGIGAGGGGGVGGATPGGNDTDATPPPPPPVGGVGSPLEVGLIYEEDVGSGSRSGSADQLAPNPTADEAPAADGGADSGGGDNEPTPTEEAAADGGAAGAAAGGGAAAAGGGGAAATPTAAGPDQTPAETPSYVVIQIPFSVSTESLRRFVRFLYTFEIQVIDANMRQEQLFLSNYFDVPSLKEACKKFMSEKVSSKNVFLYMEEALNMRVESMVDECMNIIRVNRNLFVSDDTFRDVTLQQMERILAAPQLPVTEEHLFNFAVEWTKRLAKTGPQLEKMFKLIRFPTMRPQFIANVVSFGRILPDYDLASIFTDALSTPPTPKFGIYSSTKRAITPVLSISSVEFGNFTIEYKDKTAIANLRPHILKVGGIDKEGFLMFGPDGTQLDEARSLSESGLRPNDRIQLQAMIVVNVKPVRCSQCVGGPWQLQVRDNEVVLKVKEMLSRTQNIAMSRIILRFGLETLVDSERLSFYGIVGGAEVEMLLKSFVVGDDNVATGGRAKASSTWGSPYEAEKAFEDSSSSLWVSKQMKNVPFEPQWIQYSLSSPLAVGKFAFKGTVWSRQLPTGPTKYQFQGSNDEATWTLLFREENGAEWKSTSDERVHLIQDPKPFRHYRLLVTQTEWVRSGKYGRNEDYAVEIRNIRFYEAKL